MAAPPVIERHRPHFHRKGPVLENVRAATTANITIATALNNGDTLDGITLATDDRVLVKDQSTASQNGIYVVGASPARAYDQSTDDPGWGFLVFVREGTANAGTFWANRNTASPTIGSTSLTFSAIGGTTAASGVSVTDSAGYWTAVNVETVLAEIGALLVGVTAHGNTGATETFAATTGVHTANRDASSTYTFTALASGLASGMVLILTAGTPGPYTVTWPGSVVWPGGVAPTLSDTPAAVDVFTFLSVDGGTTWFGFPTGGGAVIDYAESGDLAAVGETASAGVSTEIPRADHVHTITDGAVMNAGYWDVVVSGSAPPVAVSTPSDDDWVVAWVNL